MTQEEEIKLSMDRTESYDTRLCMAEKNIADLQYTVYGPGEGCMALLRDALTDVTLFMSENSDRDLINFRYLRLAVDSLTELQEKLKTNERK